MPTQGDYTGTINWDRNAPSLLATNPPPTPSSASGTSSASAPAPNVPSNPQSFRNPKIARRAGGVTGELGMSGMPYNLNSKILSY